MMCLIQRHRIFAIISFVLVFTAHVHGSKKGPRQPIGRTMTESVGEIKVAQRNSAGSLSSKKVPSATPFFGTTESLSRKEAVFSFSDLSQNDASSAMTFTAPAPSVSTEPATPSNNSWLSWSAWSQWFCDKYNIFFETRIEAQRAKLKRDLRQAINEAKEKQSVTLSSGITNIIAQALQESSMHSARESSGFVRNTGLMAWLDGLKNKLTGKTNSKTPIRDEYIKQMRKTMDDASDIAEERLADAIVRGVKKYFSACKRETQPLFLPTYMQSNKPLIRLERRDVDIEGWANWASRWLPFYASIVKPMANNMLKTIMVYVSDEVNNVMQDVFANFLDESTGLTRNLLLAVMPLDPSRLSTMDSAVVLVSGTITSHLRDQMANWLRQVVQEAKEDVQKGLKVKIYELLSIRLEPGEELLLD